MKKRGGESQPKLSAFFARSERERETDKSTGPSPPPSPPPAKRTRPAEHVAQLDALRYASDAAGPAPQASEDTSRRVRRMLVGRTEEPGDKGAPREGGSVQYTPLERQILALKEKHRDMILIIEVGYKLKFYGEDARIASQLLNIVRTSAQYAGQLTSVLFPRKAPARCHDTRAPALGAH